MYEQAIRPQVHQRVHSSLFVPKHLEIFDISPFSIFKVIVRNQYRWNIYFLKSKLLILFLTHHQRWISYSFPTSVSVSHSLSFIWRKCEIRNHGSSSVFVFSLIFVAPFPMKRCIDQRYGDIIFSPISAFRLTIIRCEKLIPQHHHHPERNHKISELENHIFSVFLSRSGVFFTVLSTVNKLKIDLKNFELV